MPTPTIIIILLVIGIVGILIALILRINRIETPRPATTRQKRYIVRSVHVDALGNTIYYLIFTEFYGSRKQIREYVQGANTELMNTPGYDPIRGLGRQGIVRYDYIIDNEQ